MDNWPYFLAAAALLLGVIIGWLIQAARARHIIKTRGGKASQLEKMDAAIAEKQARLQEIRTQLAQLSTELSDQTRLLVETQTTLREKGVQDAKDQEQSDRLLDDLSKHIEELELLTQLEESYTTKIKRLSQQVQWQDSELRRLRQATKAKTGEMDEAQGLLDQRDSELRRLIRQRQQREADVDNARELVEEKDDELQRLLNQHKEVDEGIVIVQRSPIPPARQFRDITPPPLPEVRSGQVEGASVTPSDEFDWEDEGEKDDLTQIAGLGDLYVRQFYAQGVTTFRRLARMTPAQVDRLLNIPGHYSPDIPGWIAAAKRLAREKRAGG